MEIQSFDEDPHVVSGDDIVEDCHEEATLPVLHGEIMKKKSVTARFGKG